MEPYIKQIWDTLALDYAIIVDIFGYLSTETYIVHTYKNHVGMEFLMSTHNVCLGAKIWNTFKYSLYLELCQSKLTLMTLNIGSS